VEYILGQYWRYSYLAIVNIINDFQINGKPHLSQIKYNASGVLVGGVFANGERLKRTYNTSGQPTATDLAMYTLDAVGTIKGINTNNTSTTASNIPSATQINQNIILTYDAMNRLTRWEDTYTQTPAVGTKINTTATADYTWDTNANRQSSILNQSSQINTQAATTTNNTQTLSYTIGNRLSNNTTTRLVGTVANNTNQAIIIDAVGSITNDGLRQYKYTAGNQLSSILSAGKTTQYTYDINNRRVSKTSGTSSTAYIYAEDLGEGSTALSATSLLGEYTTNNSNITSKEYVYLGDTPIAVVQGTNILTVQTDHLDTPRQLTDNTKKIVWNWAYSAFGENQPTTTNNTIFNLRYPG
jgi:YD repeat-containing protein